MNYAELVQSERARFERAPLSELRATRLALALHCYSNTLEEKARADALEEIIHDRCRNRFNARRA
jgi:hypothetical protein